MKYTGWILGVLVIAGAGYVGYYYGSGKLGGESNTESGTNLPHSNSPIVNDMTSGLNGSDNTSNTSNDDTVYIGPTYVTISSPKNGEVVVADNSFAVSGTVSPNANKLIVFVYETSYWNGLDSPLSEKKVDEYTLTKFKLGDSTWSYQVNHEFDNIHFGAQGARYLARAFFTDNTFKESQIQITYTFETAEMGKPVIYLYPQKTIPVAVNVMPTSGISYSEPQVDNTGWQVIADSNGRLIDASGKTWPYLFWEGFAVNFVTPKEGFVVARDEIVGFFSEKLAFLGMNQKEIADFEEFWIPRMQDKPYYFITFINQKIFNNYAPLTVTPTPDTVIRIFFDHKGLDQKIEVPVQMLEPAPTRSGFTVVEWGGRLYR